MKNVAAKSWELTDFDGRRYSTNTPPGGGLINPIFIDDFNYVSPSTATPEQLDTTFQANGWGGALAENGTGLNTSYLYTDDEIPGFAGTFPAGARVLVLEDDPNNGNDDAFLQADYWAIVGSEGTAVQGDIPPNFWCDFWYYAQNQPGLGQGSTYAVRDKFLYPVTVDFPGNSNPGEGAVTCPWLVLLGRQGFEAPEDVTENYNLFIGIQAFAAVRDTTAPDGNSDKLYQNLSQKQLLANEWTRVRINIDITGANGKVQAWLRAQDDLAWTKIMNWEVGVTANFAWTTYVETRAGNRLLRMPTTTNADPVNNPARDGLGAKVRMMQLFQIGGTDSPPVD